MSADRYLPAIHASASTSPNILMSSRRSNIDAQVTGALLATDKYFAHVLEGEQEAVEETYGRITRDPRHQDIVLLLTEPIAARQFPDFSMAYIGPSQAAEEAVAPVTKTLPGTEKGEAARDLVRFMSRVLATCDGGSSPAEATPSS